MTEHIDGKYFSKSVEICVGNNGEHIFQVTKHNSDIMGGALKEFIDIMFNGRESYYVKVGRVDCIISGIRIIGDRGIWGDFKYYMRGGEYLSDEERGMDLSYVLRNGSIYLGYKGYEWNNDIDIEGTDGIKLSNQLKGIRFNSLYYFNHMRKFSQTIFKIL